MSRYTTLILAVLAASVGLVWAAARCALAQDSPAARAGEAAPGGASRPASTGPAEFDATFVRMKVPEKVTADEVFAAAITLRNTGAKSWWCEAVRLRSVQPQNNRNWGAAYILIAQGRRVEPGAEYTFSSNLRAPSQPGKVVFCWRPNKGGNAWFGQPTPERVIQVVARPARQAATAPAPATQGARKVLAFDDFEYVGSFKPPKVVKPARGAFSETGMTLLPAKDGSRRMLLNYTHPSQVLFEIEVPTLLKATDHPHTKLAEAAVRKVWGAVRLAKQGAPAVSPNAGICWDPKGQRLYWSSYHGYWTGGSWPLLGCTRLHDDGTMTHAGPWRAPAGLYKSYWGGVTRLPKDFAEKHTGGRMLALGFGGYYSICGAASRGPALGAIAPPDPDKGVVDLVEMLVHPSKAPAPRDGDYFSANCGFWADRPQDRDAGFWTFDDHCRAGAFVHTPHGHAYVAFVDLGTGRLGYDFGHITSAGRAQYWYFYDPADLAKAAAGRVKPWAIRPRSMTKLRYPLGGPVTDSCYDQQNKLLYVVNRSAYRHGRESYPCVNVYRVR